MGLRMNSRLQLELHLAAARFGTTTDAILGRQRDRVASRARRAVWAALLTRYPGGEFPAAVLARAFGRTADIIREGAEMHLSGRQQWRRRRKLKRRRAKRGSKRS
jgi:hypothetical protein